MGFAMKPRVGGNGGGRGREGSSASLDAGCGFNEFDRMNLLERITVNPAICHGKPCIRGLRYPVEMVLELMTAGMTSGEILADYPDLEPEDLRACLAYATRLARFHTAVALAS